MQTKPTNWDTYLATTHTYDTKVVIGGVTYENDDIISLKTSGELYEQFGVGNCCSRMLEVEYYPTASPVRQASVSVSTRVESNGNYTSYVPKGTFFISKRETNHVTGSLTLTCYDSMLKAEQPFTEVFDDEEDFPMLPQTVVSRIAYAILGDATAYEGTFSTASYMMVQYPVDEDGDMTLREMLSRIASSHGGNFIVTDTNKLRFVPLKVTSTAINIGANCGNLDRGIQSEAIANVVIVNNDGEEVGRYPSVEVSGKTLTVNNPDGSADMAQYIHGVVSGYQQYGFTADSAIVDMCAELGDRVTVGTTGDTITSVIVSQEINYDALCSSVISSPDADEIEDEYPYQTYEQRLERKVAGTYSKITKTQDSISLIVDSTTGNVTAAKIIASINDDTSQVKISANKVDITGFVTFSDLSTSGRTSINGDNLTTGTINANDVSVNNAFAVKNGGTTYGYVGAAQGTAVIDGQEVTTYGAMLKSVDGNSYVIVTNAGVRMQYGNTSLYVVNGNIYYKIAGGSQTPLGYAVFS